MQVASIKARVESTPGLSALISNVTSRFQTSLSISSCAATARCWKLDAAAPGGLNFTACVDTFRGYRCECPAGFKGSAWQIALATS